MALIVPQIVKVRKCTIQVDALERILMGEGWGWAENINNPIL
jgi:hypothetical protein